jgi:hypothetical protein
MSLRVRDLVELLSAPGLDPDALVVVDLAGSKRRHLVRCADVTRIRIGRSYLDRWAGGAWLPALVLDALEEEL